MQKGGRILKKFSFWNRKKQKVAPSLLQSSRSTFQPFSILNGYTPLTTPETKLYEAIREGVPLVDTAIFKTVRLVGGFEVICQDKVAQRKLNYFIRNVNVNGIGIGLETFMAEYLDDLLTYGNAVGEIVLEGQQGILGLYRANLERIQVKPAKNPLGIDFFVNERDGALKKVANQELILFTALNPKAEELRGNSILRSLPFVTNILFKIYHSIGQNFDRIGNVRYAVSYKPSNDPADRAYAKERAQMIAREWSEGMKPSADGQVKDFITTGDVSIKVIGADNQLIETETPVRQMLEQIVAKLSIPPFLLGLSWSTTERMSKQQTDILTTELDYYRRLLTPIILKICRVYLRLNGFWEEPEMQWNTINLRDEVDFAQAQYYLAQAQQIQQSIQSEEIDETSNSD